jgi:hypothetical protein
VCEPVGSGRQRRVVASTTSTATADRCGGRLIHRPVSRHAGYAAPRQSRHSHHPRADRRRVRRGHAGEPRAPWVAKPRLALRSIRRARKNSRPLRDCSGSSASVGSVISHGVVQECSCRMQKDRLSPDKSAVLAERIQDCPGWHRCCDPCARHLFWGSQRECPAHPRRRRVRHSGVDWPIIRRPGQRVCGRSGAK